MGWLAAMLCLLAGRENKKLECFLLKDVLENWTSFSFQFCLKFKSHFIFVERKKSGASLTYFRRKNIYSTLVVSLPFTVSTASSLFCANEWKHNKSNGFLWNMENRVYLKSFFGEKWFELHLLVVELAVNREHLPFLSWNILMCLLTEYCWQHQLTATLLGATHIFYRQWDEN